MSSKNHSKSVKNIINSKKNKNSAMTSNTLCNNVTSQINLKISTNLSWKSLNKLTLRQAFSKVESLFLVKNYLKTHGQSFITELISKNTKNTSTEYKGNIKIKVNPTIIKGCFKTWEDEKNSEKDWQSDILSKV